KISIYTADRNIIVNCPKEAKQVYIYNTLGSLIKMDNNVNGLKKFDMSHELSEYYFVKGVTQYSVYNQKVLIK
ncbi:MAG: hypothetical protein Q8904_15195, partial [Bacteroidota bacterium]|nr:hypothetical protein [Bacteroidota bacterium]